MLRHLPERSRATSWGIQEGTTLEGRSIVIIGAGGTAQEAVRLFGVFNTRITVVGRKAETAEGADRTVTITDLADVLPSADVLVLAAALTSDTAQMIGAQELALLEPSCVLVNIARGKLLDTEALLQALAGERLAGAALDVTDPEPLTDGHPLWTEPR